MKNVDDSLCADTVELHLKTYCLYCATSSEQKVITQLANDGYTPLAPQVMRWSSTPKGVLKVAAMLLPGYVFFDSDTEPDWAMIKRYSGVYKVLQYEDGERALCGADLQFVEWLKRHNGMMDISRAINIGTKIEFIDGPLAEKSCKVISINKKRRSVQVCFENEKGILMDRFWLSLEFIEQNSDTDKLHQSTQA